MNPVRCLWALLAALPLLVHSEPLQGTQPLTGTNDLAAEMVDGISRYLQRETESVAGNRVALPSVSDRTVEEYRGRLKRMLGVVDARETALLRVISHVPVDSPLQNGPVAKSPGFSAYAVAWNAVRGVGAEGYLLIPDGVVRADVIAIPDCEMSPEQWCGLTPGLDPQEQLGRRLAQWGFRVLVPALISRDTRLGGNPGVRLNGHSQRETLWRAAYEMGRTPGAYELQQILAAVDWFGSSPTHSASPTPVGNPSEPPRRPIGVVGYGEGGRLALLAAALDLRVSAAFVSGYFGPRDRLWEEPIDRNVFGQLREFGDAEIAALVAPRPLWLEAARYPEAVLTDAKGGAPGRLWRPDSAEIQREFDRRPELARHGAVLALGTPSGLFGKALEPFAAGLAGEIRASVSPSETQVNVSLPDLSERQLRQYRQVLEDTQVLMREGEFARREFWKKADFRSLAGFTNSASWYRDYFRSNVIGIIPKASLPPSVRSRFLGESRGVRRFEVVLDVHPDVFAYGILCVPATIRPGERRPVVVCQHGLEGRPTDVSDPAVESPYYHQYGLRLAERGFVTFAPQNPYIGKTRFRQVLRQAQPLGLTLWSFIVRQHEVITDWLSGLEFVDPARIGFYGLSYGGKTAMRVPACVDRYCLSICLRTTTSGSGRTSHPGLPTVISGPWSTTCRSGTWAIPLITPRCRGLCFPGPSWWSGGTMTGWRRMNGCPMSLPKRGATM